MAALNVKINNVEFKNPIITASGTFGYGLEFADLVPLDKLGGIIVKGQLYIIVREMIIHGWQKRLKGC